MRESRESFVFYKSFHEATESFSDEQYGKIMRLINTYALTGEAPEISDPIMKMAFRLIKPQIDANNERYENGKKGGRPKKEKPMVSEKTENTETEVAESSDISAEEKPMVIENDENKKPMVSENAETEKPNVNVNVNANENVNVNVNVEDSAEAEPPRTDSDTDSVYKKICDWTASKDIEISESSKVQLYYRLSNLRYDTGFLDYCWDYILGQYPTKTKNEVISLFVKSATTFKNLVSNYATLLSTKISEAEAEERKERSARIKSSAPKTCSCGEFMTLPEDEGGILTVRCSCGNYSQYSPNEGKWIFTDKRQVESFDLMKNFRVGTHVGA